VCPLYSPEEFNLGKRKRKFFCWEHRRLKTFFGGKARKDSFLLVVKAYCIFFCGMKGSRRLLREKQGKILLFLLLVFFLPGAKEAEDFWGRTRKDSVLFFWLLKVIFFCGAKEDEDFLGGKARKDSVFYFWLLKLTVYFSAGSKEAEDFLGGKTRKDYVLFFWLLPVKVMFFCGAKEAE
jgi:hypothetical protein